MKKVLVLLVSFLVACSSTKTTDKESYRYLEDVYGDKAMQWVEGQNKLTLDQLKSDPRFQDIEARTLGFLNTKDKIPRPTRVGNRVYNLWKDKKNPKGLLRSKSLTNYVANKGKWLSVLDIDRLAKREKINWFYKGMSCNPERKRQCLLFLSKDGTDATSVREFDLKTRRFVKNGFRFPISKSRFTFIDQNTLYVSDGFDKKNLTKSGYPKNVRIVKRGQKVADGKLFYSGQTSDVSVGVYPVKDPVTDVRYFVLYRGINFFESEQFLINQEGKLEKFLLPSNARIESFFANNIYVKVNKDWKVQGKTFRAGTLVTFPLDEAVNKPGPEYIKVVFKPTKEKALQTVYTTKDKVYLLITNNVNRELYSTRMVLGNEWKMFPVTLPEKNGFFYLNNVSTDHNDFFFRFQSITTPPSLYYVKKERFKKAYTQKLFFDSSNIVVTQKFAESKDGTRVPYFMAHKKGMKLDGNNPTIVYGYGGFNISLAPYHSSSTGMFWLERGGVYVIANIRGGGEYGPAWHQAALKTKRQNAYDDFYAVADDLIKNKITSPAKLAVKGGSNGGLLTAVAFTQRPDLYGAVISAVPLTDMLRFDQLLAGASWVAEYGSPKDKVEGKFLRSISPYHNVKKKKDWAPALLLKTSTSDDRVHPGHARKMASKAKDLGHNVFYFENTDGGHGGGDNYKQDALGNAVEYTFLYNALKMNSN